MRKSKKAIIDILALRQTFEDLGYTASTNNSRTLTIAKYGAEVYIYLNYSETAYTLGGRGNKSYKRDATIIAKVEAKMRVYQREAEATNQVKSLENALLNSLVRAGVSADEVNFSFANTSNNCRSTVKLHKLYPETFKHTEFISITINLDFKITYNIKINKLEKIGIVQNLLEKFEDELIAERI